MVRLAVRGVTRRFAGSAGEVVALEDLSLEVRCGELVVLAGPSGCGKSTLLNLIAGLDRPDAGEVLEDGRRVEGPGRNRGVVFQDGALFPWLTARGNVEFGLRQMRLARAERRARAEHFLNLVQLAGFAESFPHELSGGMRQRVAIARALAMDPEVLLMDEPFSALDAQTREDLYLQLVELWEKTGKTILFVTHNVREAVCLASRVVLLTARPGRVAAEFPVRLDRPRFPDDADVVQLAQAISHALRGHRKRLPLEQDHEEWNDPAAGVLRAVAGLLGGGGPAG